MCERSMGVSGTGTTATPTGERSCMVPLVERRTSARAAWSTVSSIVFSHCPSRSMRPMSRLRSPSTDLSDFFYVWLKRSLRSVWPELFATTVTRKSDEFVATPYRFDGSRALADQHFEHGLGAAFARRSRNASAPAFLLSLAELLGEAVPSPLQTAQDGLGRGREAAPQHREREATDGATASIAHSAFRRSARAMPSRT